MYARFGFKALASRWNKSLIKEIQDESTDVDYWPGCEEIFSKEIWVSLLQAAGLDEAGMKSWHIEFEKTSPEAHQDFLESIGIEKDEIISIREWSKPGG